MAVVGFKKYTLDKMKAVCYNMHSSGGQYKINNIAQ
jgi:hypothetical protein